MNTARKLIDQLAAHGGRVFLENDRLRVATRASLPHDLLTRLREAKEEIRRELTAAPVCGRVQRERDRRDANAVVQEAEASVFVDEHSSVVMTVPSGDDPLATAAELIRLARSNAVARRVYRFRLTDDRETDRRNADAARSGSTASYCLCGQFAPLAWPDHDRRPIWICDECALTRGRA